MKAKAISKYSATEALEFLFYYRLATPKKNRNALSNQ